MITDFSKPTLLALFAMRITPSHSEPLVLVVQLTPTRAEELLRAMNHVATLANHSSRIFKLCSFESSAALTSICDLQCQPKPQDFVILHPDFRIKRTVPTKYIEANIFPWSICWTAYDAESLIVSTSEISMPMLRSIANGDTIEPGSSKDTLTSRLRLAPVFLNLPKYRDPLR